MFFDKICPVPGDPIFGHLEAFRADPRPHKISLMVGIYRDDHLESHPLRSVEKAKQKFANQELTADYLPIDGLHEMAERLGALVFGEARDFYAAHTTGGTGALRAGAELVAQKISKTVYVPDLTWPNHLLVFKQAGCEVKSYPYYKAGSAFPEFLSQIPPFSAVLLHASCHNPTGLDPTHEEWERISLIMKQRNLFPFFDCAYQGFGEGIEEDVSAIRRFHQDGHEMFVAYSCSKNFSMYQQRTGAFFAVGSHRDAVASHFKRNVRALYSNPPAYGAQIVLETLRSYKELWLEDLEQMRNRLNSSRCALADHLERADLKEGKGMFVFLDLVEEQIQKMRNDFAIYLLERGRVSLSGISPQNIQYVADCLKIVCEEK